MRELQNCEGIATREAGTAYVAHESPWRLR